MDRRPDTGSSRQFMHGGDDGDLLRVLAPEPDPTPNPGNETTPLLTNGNADGHGNGRARPAANYADFGDRPWWRTPSVYWLVGPYFLFIVAYGGTIVPKINLILQLVCKRYYADLLIADPSLPHPPPVVFGADNEQCLAPAVQRRASAAMAVINFIIGLLSALVAPHVGHLSDRYGRTRLLAFASFGGLLSEAVTIIVVKMARTIDYRWLFLGAFFEGMTGSFFAANLLGQSYTSDCTAPSRRGVAIGYMYACLFTGLALGPLLAGWLVEHTGSLLSIFYIAVSSHAAFIVTVLLAVPESLSRGHQRAAREKHARRLEEARARRRRARAASASWWLASLQIANPLAPLRVLSPRGPGSSPQLVRNLLSLAVSDALLMMSAMSVWPVLMLYCEFIFRWGNFETSLLMSYISSMRVVVLLGVMPIINYVWRIRPARARAREGQAVPVSAMEKNSGADGLDFWIIRGAILLDIVGALGLLLARSPASLVAASTVASLGGMATPTIQAALTKHVPADRVGQLLGALSLLNSLGRVVGPLVFSGVYYATVETMPQAVFLLMAGLYVVALLSNLLVRPGVYLSEVDKPNSAAAAEEDEDIARQALLADDVTP